MRVEELTKFECEKDDRVVVRVFMNGQYMTTCRIIDNMTRIDNALVLDVDLEIFEMEKK